ncbi:MAG: DUF2066 domain-containing protein [Rhodospirillaceae bacterium]|nr:DUF2066 domain-containing protein [Rhodospirillaceae bacterium]MBT4220518.1 DUF2066 domain-containing protein [Rhodospirillaceae bacterium]MBT4463734.1 DUF2066 domain-containing protein [Rhodospirillaceae bacterium]MBT5014741.1 DUF2066 domain-containing protein [Rhodospirillaceae bacterium]MBT5309429.1 DUF2066 domain-containing protein [Rhodospirillaceae bacterium]
MIENRRKSPSRGKTLLLALFGALLGLVVVTGGAAYAQEPRVFEVRDVAVDVTAASTNAAREKALALGERMAFARLLDRLTMRVDQSRLPDFSASEIAAYVQDFEVAEEKASAVRYLARLNFRFKAEDVRNFLIDRTIPFAETSSKPVLVLPVYQAAGTLLLWDEPNPWRDAWRDREELFSLVPTMLPKGDLSDIATIGPEQAVNGDSARLSAIAGRYDAGDTVVAQAILILDRGRPDLEVYVTRYGTAQVEQTVVKSFASQDGESVEQLLSRAAAELTRQIEDNWKRDNLLQFGRRAVVAVTIKIDGLHEWLRIRQRLADVAVIRRTDLVILSLDEVRVNLHYLGEPDQLSLALKQADLSIVSDGDGWLLQMKPGK